MNNALFIGATDISDLLHYLSKIIAVSGKKVLLIDGTEERFIRFGTPLPSKTIKIVEFEGFDVAIGFNTLSELDKYLGKNHQYETLILHTSGKDFIEKSDLSRFESKFIATTSEKMSLDKTIIAIHFLLDGTTQFEFTKISINTIESNVSSDFLERVLSGLQIQWSIETIELFYDEVDYSIKVNNQHEGKIEMRRLSRNYKAVLKELVQVLTVLEKRELKSVIKQVSRRSSAWGK